VQSRVILAALTTVLTGHAAMAHGQPSLTYFTGAYHVNGQGPAGLFQDEAYLTPQGNRLTLATCQQGEGSLQPDDSGEGAFLFGMFQGTNLVCQWFNTYDNYPLIACQAEGVAITFWPNPAEEGAGLVCPP
jgi:hypothetical protein